VIVEADFEEVCEFLPVDRRSLIEVIRQKRGDIRVIWRGDAPVSLTGARKDGV
jgi:hypothetical protein